MDTSRTQPLVDGPFDTDIHFQSQVRSLILFVCRRLDVAGLSEEITAATMTGPGESDCYYSSPGHDLAPDAHTPKAN